MPRQSCVTCEGRSRDRSGFNGQWTVDRGQRTVDNGQQATGNDCGWNCDNNNGRAGGRSLDIGYLMSSCWIALWGKINYHNLGVIQPATAAKTVKAHKMSQKLATAATLTKDEVGAAARAMGFLQVKWTWNMHDHPQMMSVCVCRLGN